MEEWHLEQLRDGTILEALTAADQLSRSRSKRAIPLLSRRMRADISDGDRLAFSAALAAIGEASCDAFVELLKDDNVRIRYAAAHGLRTMTTPPSGVLGPLLSALDDMEPYPDDDVDWIAAQVLAQMGSPAVDALLQILQTETSFNARYHACVSLGWLGQAARKSLPLLQEIAKSHEDSHMREAARNACDEILSRDS